MYLLCFRCFFMYAYTVPGIYIFCLDETQSVGIKSFDELLDDHGHGDGCEVCKPLVSGILASVNNDMIFDNNGMTLQDTNDRALANMQRGAYTIVGHEDVPHDSIVFLADTFFFSRFLFRRLVII